MFLLFLSSGLFLGWSLGANDAANIFGTAVGTRMVKFKTAAVIGSLFVIVGAILQGSGATGTLISLGSVNAIAGSFSVALAAGLIVFFMTKFAIPVSTSQAIVGGIIGWNIYTGNPTNYGTLGDIIFAWISGPVLGAVFAILLYLLFKSIVNNLKIHMFRLNAWIKTGLLLVGAFGAYSLGANNIANVMGVFVPAVSWDTISLFGIDIAVSVQLFLLGGIAISIGIFTYSRRIMKTVGNQLFKLSAESAIVVVLANALVLFVFSSASLQGAMLGIGIPALPLVPVSSSQVIVGAVIGIGLFRGAKGINFGILGQIAVGWVLTPVITALISIFVLFMMDQVFNQQIITG